jgi:MoaA/NifB/PqqE/SkfB family radical SAM enzyme
MEHTRGIDRSAEPTGSATDPVPIPDQLSWMRQFPLDSALLLFDRESGTNVLCEGPETAHLRQLAPRVVQFGITNQCNLTCSFCSRDPEAESGWNAEDAFRMLAGLAQAGVLEVAFGGGEPWAFRGFADLIRRLYDETPLAVSFTTNGIALTRARLHAIRGRYGQCRLSLYDDNDWPRRVALLADTGARFGVNYLVTPARMAELEAVVLRLVGLGCRDVLLLSYNGSDAALHLNPSHSRQLADRTRVLARALVGRASLKLDVCWGDRLEAVPRLFERHDCGAGREFVVLTSDRCLMPCSFHHQKLQARTAGDVMDIWRNQQDLLGAPSRVPGCARAPGFGLSRLQVTQ